MTNKLSTDLMALLSADPDESVRERIAYNKNTPLEILERLANDGSAHISAHSRKRLEQSA
jgi:hypothetical protein